MPKLTITELRKMAKDHTEKYIKCSEAIDKAVSAISARKDCNGVVVADQCDPIEPAIDSVDTTSADALRERIVNGSLYKGVPITEAEILAHRNSRRVVNGDDDVISFTFDGEVPSISDVLKLDFGFHTTTEPTLMLVRYTCKKHHYFDKSKLENYIANMDDEDNKLILQYDSAEEKVLMVEDRTIDISVGLDGKISADDIAEIIYSNATKLI